jgi:hypothetical protein
MKTNFPEKGYDVWCASNKPTRTRIESARWGFEQAKKINVARDAKIVSILQDWESYDDVPNGVRQEFNEFCAVNEKARYLDWTDVTRISFVVWLLEG